MLDVNGTKHHLLLGESDWRFAAESSPRLQWSPREQALRLKEQVFRFPRPPANQAPDLSQRRGAARDRFGNWYWVDETRQEIRFAPGHLATSQAGQHFWRSADAQQRPQMRGDFEECLPALSPVPQIFGGLTVTTLHYLVVGVISPPALVMGQLQVGSADILSAGKMPALRFPPMSETLPALLIFDLHAGGAPLQLDWPADFNFSPFELAPLPDGGVVILDRALTNEAFTGARLWFLNCHFQLTAPAAGNLELAPATLADFRPVDGALATRPAITFPRGVHLQKSQSPPAPIYAAAIEALPNRNILILENNPAQTHSTIYRFHGDVQLGAPVELTEPFNVRGHDFAFVTKEASGENLTGVLFVVDADGNQAFAYQLQTAGEAWSLQLESKFFPMRLFSNKGLVAAGDRAYYDADERWLALVEQARSRFEEEATAELPTFDGKIPQCVWHRLFIDGCIPPGAEVIVESRAADLPELLPHLPYRREPRLYLRPGGSEAPFAGSGAEKTQPEKGKGTWELLFQNCRGRFQQLRLTWRGNGRITPLLHALRSYYPRFSYAKEYLPAVYREEESAAAFLDRFLGNVEGFLTIWEGAIANAQILFDTRTIPAEYLDWLAGWFGLALDPSWDESRRRLLLRHAIELFNQRGTRRGILNAIALATAPCPQQALMLDGAPQPRASRFTPRLIERFLLRRAPGVVFGDPRQATGPGVTTEISKWTPADGAEILHSRYREFLRQRYAANGEAEFLRKLNIAWGKIFTAVTQVVLPPLRPLNPQEQLDWRDFLREGIGFTYAEVDAEDRDAYRAFLARRYRRPSALATEYQMAPAITSFSQVELPTVLPAAKPRLSDWIQFVSIHLPTLRAAHRFTVLLPATPSETLAEQQRRAALVKEIIALEKPAHASFEVAFYFALFRAGEARLEIDTLLDAGSRFTALQLGHSQLAGAVLAASAPPWNVQERFVASRDRVARRAEGEGRRA